MLVLGLLTLFAATAFAQTPAVKYGKISPDDFKSTVYSIDSNANAVVIADIGSTDFVGNMKGWFSLQFKFYRRAHILNKNGYDIADVEITLYNDGDDEEKLQNLRATTYNLENGKVVATKLDTKSGVFKDKLSKNITNRKFTFPNVKEGSIIEYEYTLTSDFLFNLQPWIFQGAYPRLWSEYTVGMPQFFGYVTLMQGYHPFAIREQKDSRENYTVSDSRGAGSTDRTSFTTGLTSFHWAMKDVPALKEENFTSTLANHIAKIQFQLAEKRDPLVYQRYMGSWQSATKQLLEDPDFGGNLSKDNNWMSDDIKALTAVASSPLQKAKNIYNFVRDNITCTDFGWKYLQQSLKDVLRKKSGNEAEINLLLIAMLRKAGLQADPILLSTRSHGYVYALYPLMNRFDHVICQLMIDDKTYYLDATDTNLGFGRLGIKCYNGHARIVNMDASPVEFVADSLQERKLTSVFIINDEKNGISGSMRQTPGYYESAAIRARVKEKGKDFLFADIKKAFGSEITITNPVIDSLTQYDEPVGIRYDFDLNVDKEDILYINPLFGEGYKDNPFKAAQRYYPVEMPYAMDETYLLRMDVPAGYVIDEMPKQMMVKLNEEGDGLFEYRISESGGAISLRCRVMIKRAYFLPEEYEMLREFFNLVVKKQSEQIVFKKKK